MGYCVRWKGRFVLDRPLSEEHAAALYVCEETEKYPGAPLDDRFNPWRMSPDHAGFEVLTDKPGNWKAWLQYLIDHFLAPWGYTLSGSVEWTGEERGDAGTITIEDGKVKARAPKSGKRWDDLLAESRTHVLEMMADAMNNDRRVYHPAWSAAMDVLGGAPKSDRTDFDA